MRMKSFTEFINQLNEAVRLIDSSDSIPISTHSKKWGWIDPTGKVNYSNDEYRSHDHMIMVLSKGKLSRSKAFKSGWARFAIDDKMQIVIELNYKFAETIADSMSKFKNVNAVFLEIERSRLLGFPLNVTYKADSISNAISFLKYSDQWKKA